MNDTVILTLMATAAAACLYVSYEVAARYFSNTLKNGKD